MSCVPRSKGKIVFQFELITNRAGRLKPSQELRGLPHFGVSRPGSVFPPLERVVRCSLSATMFDACPFPAEPMRMWPISTRVNKPENDGPVHRRADRIGRFGRVSPCPALLAPSS